MSENKRKILKNQIGFIIATAFLSDVKATSCNTIHAFAGVTSLPDVYGYEGDGGVATSAKLGYPACTFALYGTDDILVGDYNNGVARKVTFATKLISHWAGGGSPDGSGDGQDASTAGVRVYNFCGNTNGDVYITDYDHAQVRMVNSAHIISTIAGRNGVTGAAGDNGPATSATFSYPSSCSVDSVGDIYIADNSASIRKITKSTGILKRFAGDGTGNPATAGYNGATLTASQIGCFKMFLDSSGNMFFGESYTIRKTVLGSNIMTTYAGQPGPYTTASKYQGDGGPATSAFFDGSSVIAMDSTGYMYVTGNGPTSLGVNYIRGIAPTTTIVKLVAGVVAEKGMSGGNSGPATSAHFGYIEGLYAYKDDVYVGDVTNNDVRRIGCFLTTTTAAPSATPSVVPSVVPSVTPSVIPSAVPSVTPSVVPSAVPTVMPSAIPSALPSVIPSVVPSAVPTVGTSAFPSISPSIVPSSEPTVVPSAIPTVLPSAVPSALPSVVPSAQPSVMPSVVPSSEPSVVPSVVPSPAPSTAPSAVPSDVPSDIPSASPSEVPSATPTVAPSAVPSETPSEIPSATLSEAPSATPSESPSQVPSVEPTVAPSSSPSETPSASPSALPSEAPSAIPTNIPSEVPSATPSVTPSATPISDATASPSAEPSQVPSTAPSNIPSASPSVTPSEVPSEIPSVVPTQEGSAAPSATPSAVPSRVPTKPGPTVRPTRNPTFKPTFVPTRVPTVVPYTEIAFDNTLYLKNVTASELKPASQAAVCASVTSTMGVADNKCVFVGQEQVTRRRLAVRLAALQVYQIKAVVRITASTGDFVDTVEDPNGDNLFAKLTELLKTVVETKAFSQTVRDISADLNASATLTVGDVNISAATTYTVVPPAGTSQKDDDNLSDGEYAGIIISAVFILLVCVLVVWWCFCLKRSGSAATHPEKYAEKSPKGQQNEVQSVGENNNQQMQVANNKDLKESEV